MSIIKYSVLIFCVSRHAGPHKHACSSLCARVGWGCLVPRQTVKLRPIFNVITSPAAANATTTRVTDEIRHDN